MKSQKKSNEENIHLSTFLPSNVLSELDSNQIFPKNTSEKEPNVSNIIYLTLYIYIAFAKLFKSK
jgi:hypothetical protein